MKNICFIVNDFNFFYTHRFDLAKTLIKEYGFSVSVICSVSNARSHELSKCSNNSIQIIHLPQRTENFSSIQYLWNLNKKLNLLNFDQLIFVTLELSLFGAIIGSFKKTPRMIFIISGLGHQFFIKNIKQIFLRKLEKHIFRFASLKNFNNSFIFQNADDQLLFNNLDILKNYSHYVIPGNGIDINKYSYVERNTDRLIFCYAGRASKPKGTELLIEAFSLLREIHREIELSLRLFIISHSNKDSFDLDESSGVQVFFNLDQEELVRELHDCHIFVMPSEREGLPKAVLEAASTGMPIIASNTVGTKDTVVNNLSGWIFEYPIVASLLNSMIKSIESLTSFHKVGINSRNLVIERFELHKITKKYAELLNQRDD